MPDEVISDEQTQSNEGATRLTQRARDVVAKVSDTAQQASSTVSGQVKEILDERIGDAAQMVTHLANSTKRAADDLDRSEPQLASVVRGVARNIGSVAEQLQGQSVDQLVRRASDFIRREPSLTFGLAALAGFFAFRTLKAASSDSSIGQPAVPYSAGADQFHGV